MAKGRDRTCYENMKEAFEGDLKNTKEYRRLKGNFTGKLIIGRSLEDKDGNLHKRNKGK